MRLFHKHEWMDLKDGRSRTCVACSRIELREGADWKKMGGVNAGNWRIVVRREILDGCDSLAEHRAMLEGRITSQLLNNPESVIEGTG